MTSQAQAVTSDIRAAGEPARLGDLLTPLFDGRLSIACDRLTAVTEVWPKLLPPVLAEHCRPVGINGGVLTVVVDLPMYAYELRLCSRELVGQLRQLCPRVALAEIQAVLR